MNDYDNTSHPSAIICLNPFLSHFIPTLAMAKRLEQKGYEILYLGFEELRPYVEAEGFTYIGIRTCSHKDLATLMKAKQQKELAELYRKLHKDIYSQLLALRGSVIFYHISRANIYFIPAYRTKAKLIQYTTVCGPTFITPLAPPNTCCYIPGTSRFSMLSNLFFWVRRYVRLECQPVSWKAKRFYPYTELKKISTESGLRFRFCIDGIYIKHDQIILSPFELEFPRTPTPERYCGLCVVPERAFCRNSKPEQTHREHQKTIFCSFGTFTYRYTKLPHFMTCLIKVFEKNPDWNVILSLGTLQSIFKSVTLPDNIRIYDTVDQISAIQESDLVITHGGLGTVKECLYFEKPMLVIPCSYDQKGNAAKIAYHGVGLVNQALRRTLLERLFHRTKTKYDMQTIEKQIKQLLNDKSFYNNIIDMKSRMSSHDPFLVFDNMIRY